MTEADALAKLIFASQTFTEACDSMEGFAIQLRQLDPRRMTTQQVKRLFDHTATLLEALLSGHAGIRAILDAMIATQRTDGS